MSLIHWFDIFVLLFLGASMAWSYFRGLAKEIFSIASLVAGYFVASRFYLEGAKTLAPFLPDKTLQEIVAFVLLFFLTVMLVVVAGILVRRLLHVSEAVSAADKVAGAGVGLLKGLLLLAIAMYPVALFPEVRGDLTDGAYTAKPLIGVSGALFAWLAPGLAETLEKAEKAAAKKSGDLEKAARTGKALKKIGKDLDAGKKALDELTGAKKEVTPQEREQIKKEKDMDSEALDQLIEQVDPGKRK
ncbi:MAG: CvpA family protein [Nitrospinae bacterium]|nr:CvpA family protein [Nitrospinota bacterium]